MNSVFQSFWGHSAPDINFNVTVQLCVKSSDSSDVFFVEQFLASGEF